jgi:hypothetical protein
MISALLPETGRASSSNQRLVVLISSCLRDGIVNNVLLFSLSI